MNTGEKLIATTEGVCKARSIRRVESERWNADEIMKVTGSPWKPYLYTDSDELLSRPPPPAIIQDDSTERAGRETDGIIVPRSFAITKKDLVKYGYTVKVQSIGTRYRTRYPQFSQNEAQM